ncbi:MAG: BON domain-containing protein [Burkholderiales bacterium]|nr:BON domain-containing protein [Burkholderiales bacterium]
MSVHRIPARSGLLAAVGILSLGLSACDSDIPAQRSRLMLVSNAAPTYAPPPLPPQPSIDPPVLRERVSAPGGDGTLASMVVSALLAEPGLHNSAIDVSAVDGTVILRGAAADRDSRRRATQIASTVVGVKRVQNELYVTAGSGTGSDQGRTKIAAH